MGRGTEGPHQRHRLFRARGVPVTEAVNSFVSPIRIEYRYTPGEAGSRFFREVTDHQRLVGQRCPECGKVYVPPRAFCPRDG
ncbi:MAG: zinc ribbon domain-containing protein, partial [Actinobacteria bacterium]|nr:zinc ribbon domain-containing protein [Actinomycetota bacterium]